MTVNDFDTDKLGGFVAYDSMWSFRKSSKCRDMWEELESALINL